MKINFFLAIFLLPVISLANGPKKSSSSESEQVICIGQDERHDGVVTTVGPNVKEYGCTPGPSCCAFFNTSNGDFVLGLGASIQPVTGVGSGDYSYSASVITITSTHTVLAAQDPCADPQYDYLCFE